MNVSRLAFQLIAPIVRAASKSVITAKASAAQRPYWRKIITINTISGREIGVPITATSIRFALVALAATLAMPAILGQRINRANPTEATSRAFII
jgi:hypothetical protein